MYNSNTPSPEQPPFHPEEQTKYPQPLTGQTIEMIFSDCDDFDLRSVLAGEKPEFPAAVCWLDGLTAGGDISTDVLRPLTETARFVGLKTEADIIDRILKGAVYSYTVNRRDNCDDVVQDLLNGFCAIIFDASQIAVTFEV